MDSTDEILQTVSSTSKSEQKLLTEEVHSKTDGNGENYENFSTSQIKETKDNEIPFQVKENDQKRKIFNEMVKVEQNYNDSLTTLIEKVMNPLSNKRIISNNLKNQIFSNIETIKGLHEGFLNALRMVVQNEDYLMIGKILQTMGNFIEPYCDYVNNFYNSIKTIAKTIKVNSKFNQFIDGVDLGSLLIKPVQKFAHYKLLVEELVKHTNNDHPDYEQLTIALQIIKQTGTIINERRENPEALDLSNGVLIKEGMVYCKSYESRLERKVQHKAYLFNDKIALVLDNNSSPTVTKFLKYNHLIKLTKKTIVKQHPTKKKVFNIDFYLFSCLSEDEKNIWMDNIQSAIDNLNP